MDLNSIRTTTAIFLAAGMTYELAVGGSCISAQEHTTIPAHHCDAIQPHTESEPQAPTAVRSTITIATSAERINTSFFADYKRMIRNTSGKTFELA
jgi:hypothetical protein